MPNFEENPNEVVEGEIYEEDELSENDGYYEKEDDEEGVDEYGDSYKTSYKYTPEDNEFKQYDDCYNFEKSYGGHHYEF